jgi:glycosyltransferase involved in cell wall biosynthesis
MDWADLKGLPPADRQAVENAFDEDYYLATYPDVRGADIGPLDHYIVQGWKEGRNPSARFDTRHYLDSNPDVAASGVHPFIHYVLRGQDEGRTGLPVHPVAPPQQSAPAQRLSLEEECAAIEHVFDADFYLRQNPEIADLGIEPIVHFLTQGWREGRDPNCDFSISYYVQTYPDVLRADISPFVHYTLFGHAEGRGAQSWRDRMRGEGYSPRVSAIVPNYNHARFLPQRIESILEQTYSNIEIIILDDGSTDDSREIIADYAARYPDRIRTLINHRNSGSVFAQWKKGFLEAAGELVWICESDDFCDPDFVERVIQPLHDPSVMIAFGRIQFADTEGGFVPGLDDYRENAEPGIWDAPLVRPAAEWFRGSFATANLIPNVGGCVIRNQPVAEAVWKQLLSYRIVGDWYLFSVLAGGGQIAYVPHAIAWFRQHEANVSGVASRDAAYYREHEWLISALRDRWGTPDDVAARCFENVYRDFVHSGTRKRLGSLTRLYSNDAVMAVERRTPHILIATLGFHLGGGEIFPIHLANQLVARGVTVSILRLNGEDENADVRALLDRRIAIYDSGLVSEMGITDFIERAGIDLINSHSVGAEFFFLYSADLPRGLPYAASLHGSYEVTPIPDDLLLRILRSVKQWIYLSDKNLGHLADIPLHPVRLARVPNGMPADDRPAPFTREDLGIRADAIVFAVASRAIDPKGWREAVAARAIVARRTRVPIHLLLCGSGPVADELAIECAADPFVHVLGFQDRINGIYLLADVVLLPTRFAGESFPLSLIQAMQVGRPIIATDLGEIRAMVTGGHLPPAGLVMQMREDAQAFITALADAMARMTKGETRAAFAAGAAERGQGYAIDVIADRYWALFRRMLGRWPSLRRRLKRASRATPKSGK